MPVHGEQILWVAVTNRYKITFCALKQVGISKMGSQSGDCKWKKSIHSMQILWTEATTAVKDNIGCTETNEV